MTVDHCQHHHHDSIGARCVCDKCTSVTTCTLHTDLQAMSTALGIGTAERLNVALPMLCPSCLGWEGCTAKQVVKTHHAE